MLEYKKEKWLGLFKERLVSTLRDPQAMFEAVVAREGLRENNYLRGKKVTTKYKPQDMEALNQTLRILDSDKGSAPHYELESRVPEELGKAMGFSSEEIQAMRPSEVLQYSSAVASTMHCMAENMTDYNDLLLSFMLDDNSKGIDAIKADKEAFVAALYLTSKSIITIMKDSQTHALPSATTINKAEGHVYQMALKNLMESLSNYKGESSSYSPNTPLGKMVPEVVKEIDILLIQKRISTNDASTLLTIAEQVIREPKENKMLTPIIGEVGEKTRLGGLLKNLQSHLKTIEAGVSDSIGAKALQGFKATLRRLSTSTPQNTPPSSPRSSGIGSSSEEDNEPQPPSPKF